MCFQKLIEMKNKSSLHSCLENFFLNITFKTIAPQNIQIKQVKILLKTREQQQKTDANKVV